MEMPKKLVFVAKRYAVREVKKAVRSTQGQNMAACGTPGGCHPHGNGLWYYLYQV